MKTLRKLRLLPLSLLLLLLPTGMANATDIIAHRGASYDAPENTLASVRLGYEQKADAVEIDIYLSKDGQIVVLHDNNTKRTTGVDKKVVDQNLEELRQQDAGRWKGDRFAGEKLPTLDEVIAAVPNGKRLVIEVKCGPEVIPALRQSLTLSRKPVNQFLIIAFSQPTLKEIKKALPRIEMYWLTAFRKEPETGVVSPSAEQLISKAKDAGIEGVNLASNGVIDAAFVQKIKAAGLKCYAWTIDSPDDARRLIAAGIDGITTNRPGWLRQQVLP
ncbi:MAG: glycerophosphodiester phosphodiesterase [Armatimonadota bacterium]